LPADQAAIDHQHVLLACADEGLGCGDGLLAAAAVVNDDRRLEFRVRQ
jgi:hypothetical protein